MENQRLKTIMVISSGVHALEIALSRMMGENTQEALIVSTLHGMLQDAINYLDNSENFQRDPATIYAGQLIGAARLVITINLPIDIKTALRDGLILAASALSVPETDIRLQWVQKVSNDLHEGAELIYPDIIENTLAA